MSTRLVLPCRRSFACLVGSAPQYGAALLKRISDLLTAPFTVLRLMTPLKMSYESTKETSGAVSQDPGGTPRAASGYHKNREAGSRVDARERALAPSNPNLRLTQRSVI